MTEPTPEALRQFGENARAASDTMRQETPDPVQKLRLDTAPTIVRILGSSSNDEEQAGDARALAGAIVEFLRTQGG